MPKCIDCGNTTKFYIPVTGYNIYYFEDEGPNPTKIVSEYTEIDNDRDIQCGACEGTHEIQDQEIFYNV